MRDRLLIASLWLLAQGKFYYVLYGWHDHLKPLAPGWVMILKDLAIVLLLLYCRRPITQALRENRFLRILTLLALAITAISALHLTRLPASDWLQHYGRNVLVPLFFIPVGYHLLKLRESRFFFDCFLICAALNTAVAVLTYLLAPDRLFGGRAMGLMENPITLAGVLGPAVVIALVFGMTEKTPKRQLGYLTLCVASCAGLAMTASLTYIAIAPLLFGLFALQNPRMKQAFAAIGAIALLGAMVIQSMSLISQPQAAQRQVAIGDYSLDARIQRLMVSPKAENSVNARLDGYRLLGEFLTEAPLVEVLFGRFSLPHYAKFDSMAVGLIFNVGVVGFALYLLLFFIPILIAIRTRRELKAGWPRIALDFCILGIAAFLLSGTANNNSYRFPLNIIVYLQIGMILRFARELGIDSTPRFRQAEPFTLEGAAAC